MSAKGRSHHPVPTGPRSGRRARAKGYTIWLDTETPIGHLSHFIAWPIRREEMTGLVLDFMGQGVNKIFTPGGMVPGVEHGVADVLA